MTPNEYCQEKAAKSGSSFYYSFHFLPKNQRDAIISLYAFCREVDDIVDDIKDINIAKIKLAWWRDEIEKIYSGIANHPVAIALTEHKEHFNLPKEYFIEIIDGMEMDLEYDVYPSFKELSLYCYRVASVVGLLSIEIFGYENRQTQKYAHELGMALQLTNILRDVYEDAQRGRVYLPQDELEKFGVSNDDLLNRNMNQKTIALFEYQANRARKHYEKAFSYLPDEDRYLQRSGIIMSDIYSALLNEIEKDGFRVLEHRIKLTPIRKLWIAWMGARREKNLFKKMSRRKAA